MEKKRTPAITIVFYIIGMLLLVVSAFMLFTALTYTQTYLQAYDATFMDMWSNSVQYIIAQFVPYLGMGLICFGIGKAIKEAMASAGTVKIMPAQEPEPAPTQAAADIKELEEANRKLTEKVQYLSDEMDATREVLSIKIEEKEKRDSYRLDRLGDRLEIALAALNVPVEKYAEEPAEPLEEPAQKPQEPAQEVQPEGPVPQFFRAAKVMAMPSLPEVKKEIFAPAIMRNTGRMAMPKLPEAKKESVVPSIMRMTGRMTMPKAGLEK